MNHSYSISQALSPKTLCSISYEIKKLTPCAKWKA